MIKIDKIGLIGFAAMEAIDAIDGKDWDCQQWLFNSESAEKNYTHYHNLLPFI